MQTRRFDAPEILSVLPGAFLGIHVAQGKLTDIVHGIADGPVHFFIYQRLHTGKASCIRRKPVGQSVMYGVQRGSEHIPCLAAEPGQRGLTLLKCFLDILLEVESFQKELAQRGETETGAVGLGLCRLIGWRFNRCRLQRFRPCLHLTENHILVGI